MSENDYKGGYWILMVGCVVCIAVNLARLLVLDYESLCSAPSSYDTSTPGTTTPERLRGIDGRVYEVNK